MMMKKNIEKKIKTQKNRYDLLKCANGWNEIFENSSNRRVFLPMKIVRIYEMAIDFSFQ